MLLSIFEDILYGSAFSPKPANEKLTEEPAEKSWADEESAVVHLTDDTFDTFLASTPSVLVMFYAPCKRLLDILVWMITSGPVSGCGHCKRMKPDLVEAAKRLKDEGVAGAIAAVDATKEKKVAGKHDIKGYPTVKYFKDAKFAWDYHERTADQLVSFMKE